MIIENTLFLIFSGLTLMCAIFVITAENPIHSVLFLVLVFFNVAGLLIMLGAEFLALLFLIVYVGAVAILFLFIIMMLSVKISEFKIVIYRYLPVGIVLSVIFLCEILIIFNSELIPLTTSPFINITFNSFSLNSITLWNSEIVPIQNIEVLGSIIYIYYSYFFIVSGIILLVSMIGAITLTLHRRGDVKRQDIYKQLQQDFNTAISWKQTYSN